MPPAATTWLKESIGINASTDSFFLEAVATGYRAAAKHRYQARYIDRPRALRSSTWRRLTRRRSSSRHPLHPAVWFSTTILTSLSWSDIHSHKRQPVRLGYSRREHGTVDE